MIHRSFFLKFIFLEPNENQGTIGRNKLTEENDIVVESFVGQRGGSVFSERHLLQVSFTGL